MAKPFERQSSDLRHEEAAVNRAYGWELSLNSLDHYVPRRNLQPMKRTRTADCSYVVIGRLFGRVLTCAGPEASCQPFAAATESHARRAQDGGARRLNVRGPLPHRRRGDEHQQQAEARPDVGEGCAPGKLHEVGGLRVAPKVRGRRVDPAVRPYPYPQSRRGLPGQAGAVADRRPLRVPRSKAIELLAMREITPDVRVLPRANAVGTVRKLVPLYELLGHQVKLLDSDGDGSIGISEIFSHVKQTAVQGMDLDGDGKVGFMEVIMSLGAVIKDLPNCRQWEQKLFHVSELAVLRLWGKSFLFLLSMFVLFFYLFQEELPHQAILIDHCRLQARAQGDVCKALLTEVAAAAAA